MEGVFLEERSGVGLVEGLFLEERSGGRASGGVVPGGRVRGWG